jgi:hypothetical protein
MCELCIPSCSKHRIYSKMQCFQFPIRQWTWYSIIYYLNSQNKRYNLVLDIIRRIAQFILIL